MTISTKTTMWPIDGVILELFYNTDTLSIRLVFRALGYLRFQAEITTSGGVSHDTVDWTLGQSKFFKFLWNTQLYQHSMLLSGPSNQENG